MMKKRVLEIIKKVAEMNPRECSTAKEYNEGWNRSLEWLEAYLEDENDGWIPVIDKTPEDEVPPYVLAQDERGEMHVARYIVGMFGDQDSWAGELEGDDLYSLGVNIVAWQPLPEPYCPERISND